MRSSNSTKRLGRFFGKSGGNVAMIFALSAPVLCLAVAVAIDYTNATVVKSKLNSAADAAALAALTPAMLQQSDANAQAAAVAMFNARVAQLGSLVASQTVVTVTITHPNTNQLIRQVEVDYTAQSNTIFSGVLNVSTMTIGGSSEAQASIPPNIDFYLLLDNSPSMALPATPSDLTTMENLTPTQDQANGKGNACAFACHQASTNNGDTMGNPCSDGSSPSLPYAYTQNGVTYNIPNQLCVTTDAQGNPNGVTQLDNYALARKNNVTLRLDELSTGVSTLMNTAHSYQTSGIWAAPPTYRFAGYSMDSLWATGTTNYLLMPMTADFVNGWSSSSSKFGVMEMFSNSYACQNAACDAGVYSNDTQTNYDFAMSDINTKMSNPGNGTNLPGDSPKEVLFFVTDGVEDEGSPTARLLQPINGGATTNYCDLIKGRGIKIAILYTEYLAVPTNAFYVNNVAPFQTNIAPALQACASPNLFYDAAIGTNLGAALSQLFQSVVQSAALFN